MFPAPKTFSGGPGNQTRDNQQLKRDRIEAIIVLVVTLGLFALALWASSFGSGAGEGFSDYWYMMP